MDYTELVKTLLETDFSDGCPCGAEPLCEGTDCIILQAADAIAELTAENKALREQIAAPTFIANGEILSVEPNIFDQEERHENCTVQILRNSITGAYSFGWWENREAEGSDDV